MTIAISMLWYENQPWNRHFFFLWTGGIVSMQVWICTALGKWSRPTADSIVWRISGLWLPWCCSSPESLCTASTKKTWPPVHLPSSMTRCVVRHALFVFNLCCIIRSEHNQRAAKGWEDATGTRLLLCSSLSWGDSIQKRWPCCGGLGCWCGGMRSRRGVRWTVTAGPVNEGTFLEAPCKAFCFAGPDQRGSPRVHD